MRRRSGQQMLVFDKTSGYMYDNKVPGLLCLGGFFGTDLFIPLSNTRLRVVRCFRL
jgi:hypothetical protein